MAWHRIGDKSLSKLTLISVTEEYMLQKKINASRFFLNTRIDYEFLTNDGREYHKFVSAMWCWFFLYEVVHVVHMYINHLHFADYDHVHQHFAENSFWIYQECCQMDIQAWKSQWYIILIHFTNIQNFVYKISCLREGSKWGGGGAENDLANFLSVHLTNPYSGNMAEPQQTRRHSPPGRQKSQDFLYLKWADWCEPYHCK